MGMEEEYDLFFADLSKQISLLIMDDDDDQNPVATYPSVPFQVLSGESYPIRAQNHPFLHHHHEQQSCRRESKGTGVFIPQSTLPRRKHRQGRLSSFNPKSQRQHGRNHSNHDNLSQISYNENPSNPKKSQLH